MFCGIYCNDCARFVGIVAPRVRIENPTPKKPILLKMTISPYPVNKVCVRLPYMILDEFRAEHTIATTTLQQNAKVKLNAPLNVG